MFNVMYLNFDGFVLIVPHEKRFNMIVIRWVSIRDWCETTASPAINIVS